MRNNVNLPSKENYKDLRTSALFTLNHVIKGILYYYLLFY